MSTAQRYFCISSHTEQCCAEAFSSVTKQASAHPNPDMIPVPDTGQHVFMKAKRDLGQVQVYDDGAVHELYRGDVYILRYKVVKSLLEAGAVQLV